MRKLVVVAVIAAAFVVPARAENVANTCGTRWSGSGACTFLYTGEKVTAFGVAATKSFVTAPAPAVRAPYLTLEIVWRHTMPGGGIVDEILLSCAAPAVAGMPATACSGSAQPRGLDVGTALLCTVRGRETGVFGCSAASVQAPSVPEPAGR